MPAPRDLMPYKDAIVRMFCEERLPLTTIAQRVTEMGEPVKRVRLRAFINELELTRQFPARKHTYKTTFEPQLKLKAPVKCKSCDNDFIRSVAWQTHCRACIPTHSASNCYHNHGITLPQYEAMIVAQGNRCAICTMIFDRAMRKLVPHIDHDHTSGEVRGLLCASCNVKLAGVEQVDWHERALSYLANPPGVPKTTSS